MAPLVPFAADPTGRFANGYSATKPPQKESHKARELAVVFFLIFGLGGGVKVKPTENPTIWLPERHPIQSGLWSNAARFCPSQNDDNSMSATYFP